MRVLLGLVIVVCLATSALNLVFIRFMHQQQKDYEAAVTALGMATGYTGKPVAEAVQAMRAHGMECYDDAVQRKPGDPQWICEKSTVTSALACNMVQYAGFTVVSGTLVGSASISTQRICM